MATTSDIRNGLCIKYNNDIFKIIEYLHVKPGKGPAFVRTKLKSSCSGTCPKCHVRIELGYFVAPHQVSPEPVSAAVPAAVVNTDPDPVIDDPCVEEESYLPQLGQPLQTGITLEWWAG